MPSSSKEYSLFGKLFDTKNLRSIHAAINIKFNPSHQVYYTHSIQRILLRLHNVENRVSEIRDDPKINCPNIFARTGKFLYRVAETGEFKRTSGEKCFSNKDTCRTYSNNSTIILESISTIILENAFYSFCFITLRYQHQFAKSMTN